MSGLHCPECARGGLPYEGEAPGPSLIARGFSLARAPRVQYAKTVSIGGRVVFTGTAQAVCEWMRTVCGKPCACEAGRMFDEAIGDLVDDLRGDMPERYR